MTKARGCFFHDAGDGKRMRYGSVCSGIEAATVAWKPLGWDPVFFAEIEKFPSKVLAHHYGSNMPDKPLSKNGIPNYGDFTKIGADAGPIDLLVGGSPCQSFSIAGKRLGLDDPRGNLALEYLALAKRLSAKWIVWENVPGVLSSRSEDGTSDFATFLSFVRECGYGFAYRVLDAQFTRASGYERAVPQRRRRVFLVGYLGDWRPAAAVLFNAGGMRGDAAPSRQAWQKIAPTLASRPTGGGGLGTDFDLDGGLVQTFNRQSSGEYSEQDIASTVSARDYKGASDLVAHTLRGNGFDASEDGTGRGIPLVPANWRVRKLTPRECERLQGFQWLCNSDYLGAWQDEDGRWWSPDYTAIPRAADSPRYKSLGNSMAVNVMRAIGQRIDMVETLLQQRSSGSEQ
jgi:DNA (cytosine-5)-methyltransferase 1